MRIVFLLSILASLGGCVHSKTIYDKKVDDKEWLKITYATTPEQKQFIMILTKKNKLTDHFEIKTAEQGWVVQKLILSEKNPRSQYMMTSDTANGQLKCIDFNFLEQYNNVYVLKTFMPISERERRIFSMLVEAIQVKNVDMKISQEEVNRFLGWVRIDY